jgi:large subunit ribosomal protein L22
MTGPKRNEGATKVGERVGTKATAKYLRGSPTKARVVLDLVRGLHVRDADVVLQFTDREAARAVRKVLASAVANAQNNDAQDPEELYVSACFADEGPTLRRFRPRARGRATRIRKRTCHITIIVSRMSDAELERRREKEAARTPATARRSRRVASSRRERVARRRQAAAAARGGTQPVDHDHDHEHEDHETAPEIDDSTIEDSTEVTDDVPTDVPDEDLGDALEGAPVEDPEAETATEKTDKDAGEDA